MAPVSQKADSRPIAFYLDDGVKGTTTHVPLIVRPEDLSRTEPSLMTATQTFDGAWLDDFGPGIANIQISGHTGWNMGGGWEAQFKTLRNTVFTQWHRSRADAVRDGRDPNDVKLIFADALDSIVNVVAPQNFALKRNKSSPLLMRYQISLIVLTEQLSKELIDKLKLNPDGTPSTDPLVTGVASLQASVSKLESAAARVRDFIDASVAQPLRNYLTLSTTALNKVLTVVNTARSITGAQAQQFIGIAADLALVGRNFFYAYNAVVSMPDAARFQVAQVAAAFENAFCVLRNAFRKVRLYPDYSDVYGASVCSSTIGGSPISPLAGVNTFEAILPSITLPPAVTGEARINIDRAKGMDYVLAPISVTAIGASAAVISAGVAYGD